MNTHAREMLERYANRGTARGADSVLDRARTASQWDHPAYGEPPAHRTRTRVRVLAVAAVLAVLAAIPLARALSDGSDESVGTGDAARSTTVPGSPRALTEAERAEANRRFDELVASGWVRVGMPPALEPMPPGGWQEPRIGYRRTVPLAGGDEFPEYLPDAFGVPRTPIYDRPDGQVIGYRYDNLGVVPKSVGDDPTFDVSRYYRQRGACMPADHECARALNERMGAGRAATSTSAPG